MMTSHLPKMLLSAMAFCVVLTLSPVDAAVRPPRLQYELMTLPNGLTIVLSPDHSTPIVHVELWYHVGSKDEKPGRTGFAHLFEHMMFKAQSAILMPQFWPSMLSLMKWIPAHMRLIPISSRHSESFVYVRTAPGRPSEVAVNSISSVPK
jgi:hypothetical protein